MVKVELAGCMLTDVNGRYFLLHRNFLGCQQWELPGGKVALGELPEQAAKRECREELNVEVSISNILVTVSFKEDDIYYSYQVFSGTVIDGVPINNEKDKFDAVGYFSLNELNAMYDYLSIATKLFVKTLNPSII
jgi:ADP-ribose pyrophosphatase YjhB (NUDIX family)